MILLVLAAMLWQGFASARPGSSINVLLDAQHAALHWQGEGHHHHEGDGDSYHLDDSEESASHLALDQSGVTAFHMPQAASFAALGSGAVLVGEARAGPSPFLDGPLRPPRSSD
jgi:hypothetical protein